MTVGLGFGRRSAAQQFCLATGLGLGVLSAATVALGTAGLLSRATAWGLLACGGVLGLLRVHRAQSGAGREAATGTGRTAWDVPLRSLALLPLCVPLAVALFGATLPPGWLWEGEARGYDALEYHLQAPREYFEAGYIHFLPHNVYASFPQQVETLYLLLMHLIGHPLQAAIPAQLLHVAFGVLTVVALVAWTAPGWPRILVGLAAGSVPWLAYLGCLAYVELGVLFFAALAAGLISECFRAEGTCRWQTVLTAGLCAGLAGGCKYTALVLVSAALGIAWLLTMRGGLRTRAARCALFAAGTLAAFSPWLIRSAAFTGNPVYPFAYEWLGGSAWSAEQDAQWDRGHRPPEGRDTLAGRAQLAASELFTSGMYGPALWLLPIAAVALRPSRRQALLAIWLFLIVIVWASLTYVPGRFAVVIVVPLSLTLSGVGVAHPDRSGHRRLVVVGLVLAAAAGAVWNGSTLLHLLRSDNARWFKDTGVRPAQIVGLPEAFAQYNPINQAVQEEDAHVWLIGNAAVFYLTPRIHYTVVFNRDPWIEFAAGGATAEECVAWLHTRNVTHVVFSWSEIERLRPTYGFSPIVTRQWVHQLEQAGLRRVREPGQTPGNEPTEIYEVVTE